MDLKRLKYINNTKRLPGFEGGKGELNFSSLKPISGVSIAGAVSGPKMPDKLNIPGLGTTGGIAGAMPWVSAGMAAAQQLGNFFNGLNNNDSAETLSQQAGTSDQTAGGIGYKVYNNVNVDQVMKDYDSKNLSLGSIISNPLGALGSLFGGRGKQRAAAEKARLDNIDKTEYGREVAITQGMRQRAAQEEADYNTGKMFSAYNGKDVDTAYGIGNAKQNAWVSKGEFIFDPATNTGHVVKRGPNDTAPAYLRGRDAVVTKKYGLADAAIDAYNAGDMAGVYDVLNAQKIMHMNNYKNGKDCLPRLKGGFIPEWTNIIPNALGLGASINQIVQGSREQIVPTNVYARNPYSADALRELAGLRYDEYPVVQAMLKQGSRTNASIDSSGATGSQKYLARVANANNMYSNISNVYADFMNRNIALRQAFNQARLAAGAQDAQREQAANQFNSEMFAKSLAAKRQLQQMGLRNSLDYINNYAAGEFKRRQANYMLGLYDQQNDLEKQSLLNESPKTNTITNYQYRPGIMYDTSNLKYNILPFFKR